MKPLKFFKLPVHLIVIFIFLTAGLLGAGLLYYKKQKDEILREKGFELTAIADLKVGQINRWWNERMADADSFYESIFLRDNILMYVKNTSNASLKDKLIRRFKVAKKSADYASMYLTDADGNEIIALDPKQGPLSHEARRLIEKAGQSKKIEYSDLELEEETGAIHIHTAVPYTDDESLHHDVRAVLLIAVNPEEMLFPLIQTWPIPSETAETLIVRREGDEVVFLNELRHKKNTALRLRLPMDDPRLLAAMAVAGRTGVVEGMDYRNVPILAAIEPVGAFPWFVVAKEDVSEILVPLKKERFSFGAVLILIVISAGAAVIFRWKQREAESVIEREILTSHYEYLSKYANDIIIVADSDMRIIEANEKAVDAYGYTREELIGMHIKKLRAPEEVQKLDDQLGKTSQLNGNVYETIHRKKDGSTFPVEVSARIIKTQGGGYFQGIMRDITERKQVEEALKKNIQLLMDTGEMAKVGGWELDLSTKEVSWTEEVCRIHGVEPGYKPKLEEALNFYAPESRPALKGALKKAMETGEPYDLESLFIPSGGKDNIWVRSLGVAVYSGGKIVKLAGTFQDIDKYKRAEEKIRGQLDELKRWQDVMLGREGRVHELKHEVNELCRRLGEAVRYTSQETALAEPGSVGKEHK